MAPEQNSKEGEERGVEASGGDDVRLEGAGEVAKANTPPAFVDPMLEGVDPAQLVRGPGEEKKVETKDSKIERIIRQLTNYLMVEAGRASAPADVEGAAVFLQERFDIAWPKDPWGNQYVYKRIDARSFEVYCAGPDGQSGTDDDIHVSDPR